MSPDSESLKLHRKLRGKLRVSGKAGIRDQKDLSLLYTPGVADACREIAKDKSLAYDLTMKWNAVAIVTDGTRVLGLGDIGPEAALPVMEGKALIMQQFSGIDAIPVCLDTKDEDEIVRIVKAIAPGFGAINLEDIETPKVFSIERRLAAELEIPVFHDDQHGTAIVALAALYNALKAAKKGENPKIGIVGAGSAGYAIAKLLHAAGFGDLTVFDSRGAIYRGRPGLESYKEELAAFNKGYKGPIAGFKGADVIISAASPGSLPDETVLAMNGPKIVFALSNPVPEVSMEKAEALGIGFFGTGRSDCPNQINNSLCFPGFLRALLDLRVKRISDGMKIAAAKAIAACVSGEELKKGKIVPEVFDKRVVPAIVENVRKATG